MEKIRKKIVLFSLPGMGDTLMFTPVISRLRQVYPSAFIVVVTMYRSSYQVLELNSDLDRVDHFDFLHQGYWAALRYIYKLRSEHYDMSFINYPSNRLEYNIISFLVGAKVRVGHKYIHESFLSASWLHTYSVIEEKQRHNVDENLAMLDSARIPRISDLLDPSITLDDKDRAFARQFCAEKKISKYKAIGFHLWSSELKNMHRKCWSPEKFAQLADWLHDKMPSTQILVFEGPHDGDAVKSMCHLTHAPLVVCAGSSVRQSAALLTYCSVLVSNDSGVMHLGEAVHTPCVALFGPTNPQKTAPYNAQKHTVVTCRDKLVCQPCFYYSPKPLSCNAGFDYACLTALTVPDVGNVVLTLKRDNK